MTRETRKKIEKLEKRVIDLNRIILKKEATIKKCDDALHKLYKVANDYSVDGIEHSDIVDTINKNPITIETWRKHRNATVRLDELLDELDDKGGMLWALNHLTKGV